VTGFKPGDEVYGMVGGVGGLQGTLAKFIVADSDLLALKPRSLSMRQAGAMALVTITAWKGSWIGHMFGGPDSADPRWWGRPWTYCNPDRPSKGGGSLCVCLREQKRNRTRLGSDPIDYQSVSPDEYMEKYTGGRGFDIVYDTVGGATLDASFRVAKRYTGHVLSALGWGSHSLAPLSFRGATYSGVFTLYPMLSGEGRSHHGEILKNAAALVDAGQLTPILNERQFSSTEIHDAFAAVEYGATGKVWLRLKLERVTEE